MNFTTSHSERCVYSVQERNLTIQDSRGHRMIQAIAAVAAVAAGNFVIFGPLQGQIRGGPLFELSLQDPAHRVTPSVICHHICATQTVYDQHLFTQNYDSTFSKHPKQPHFMS